MRTATLFVIALLFLLISLPGLISAQSPSNFSSSLHGTRAGKATWYSKDNGGFENLTEIPMSELPCQNCHALTYANGDTVDAATYAPGCNDCHDFSKGNTVEQKTCLGCHSRQGAEISMGLADVHREKGMVCMDCHTKREMHGDGTAYSSMLEPGAMDASCTNDGCHATASLPNNLAHSMHSETVSCNACHSTTVESCYNCHFESEVEGHQKRFYGPPPRTGFAMLVQRQGKVTTASFQSVKYGDKTFYAIGAFNGHTITKEARACSECHDSENVRTYVQTGKIDVGRWDEANKTIAMAKGIIPVPPDWQNALQFDFVDYTGDVHDPTKPLDPSKWVFLKTGADTSQMLFAEPLTEEQMAKLAQPVPNNFETSLHGTRQGKATWYSKDNGGFENLTKIPMSELPCQKCHAPTYANGDPVDAATYVPGCNDCHDFSQGNSVQQQTCLACHGRQGAEIALGFADVHRDKGMECKDCHTKREMHGDGTTYASMLEPGAMDASCDNEKCHPASALPANTSHAIHAQKVYCNACHSSTVMACYNCHFETELEAHQKRFYGPPPRNGFMMLVNREGYDKVVAASFQSVKLGDSTFYAIGPFNGHTVTKKGRDCSECHDSENVRAYKQTGEIEVGKWDDTNKTIVTAKGIIPVPPDWQTALKMDFVDYTGDVSDPTKPLDPSKWVFLKSGADMAQMLYATPLTADQIAKLSTAVAVASQETAAPEKFALAQNFPNPFNPVTMIEFHLPKATTVTVKVYNTLGVEVATLVAEERLAAGVHKRAFIADGLPSGIYFYKLSTPEFSDIRKMTLVR